MIFSCLYPYGKAGGIQIRRCQGIAVKYYGFTLGALALNPSGFCNAGVSFGHAEQRSEPGCISNRMPSYL